jgi:hypothetical protein
MTALEPTRARAAADRPRHLGFHEPQLHLAARFDSGWFGRKAEKFLLNLGFSLEAAYAAPLILLAQTRQADRDKALAIADAEQRDALARESLDRRDAAAGDARQLRLLLGANAELIAQVERLAREIHDCVLETRRP